MTSERDRLLERDAEARRLAHTEFSIPLIIEAGAGTGKTALLTARAVAWCVGERRVACDDRRIERLCQGHIHGVVRSDVLTQLPRASQ